MYLFYVFGLRITDDRKKKRALVTEHLCANFKSHCKLYVHHDLGLKLIVDHTTKPVVPFMAYNPSIEHIPGSCPFFETTKIINSTLHSLLRHG